MAFNISDIMKSTWEKSGELVKTTVEKGGELYDSAAQYTKDVMDKQNDMKQVSAMRKKIKELETQINEKKIEIGNYCYGIISSSGSIDDNVIVLSCKQMNDINYKIETYRNNIQKIKGLSTSTDILNAISTGAIIATPEIVKFVDEAGILPDMDTSTKEALLKGVLEGTKTGSVTEATPELLKLAEDLGIISEMDASTKDVICDSISEVAKTIKQ